MPGENPSQPYVASDDVNPSYEAEYREVMANLNSLVGGYHGLLWEAADSERDYERALALFDGKVGTEGRAILRAMTNPLRTTNVGG